MLLTSENIYSLLSDIPDPEIPVINIIELGIVRNVQVINQLVTITITPTYTGCPAMQVIETDIHAKLNGHGYKNVSIVSTLTPACTTDWITQEARQKLYNYGIAPPANTTASKKALLGIEETIICPRCKSLNTQMISQFGSTA